MWLHTHSWKPPSLWFWYDILPNIDVVHYHARQCKCMVQRSNIEVWTSFFVHCYQNDVHIFPLLWTSSLLAWCVTYCQCGNEGPRPWEPMYNATRPFTVHLRFYDKINTFKCRRQPYHVQFEVSHRCTGICLHIEGTNISGPLHVNTSTWSYTINVF